MPLLFGNPISTVTGKKEPTFEQKAHLGKMLFNQIKETLFPPIPKAAEEMQSGERSLADIPRGWIDKSDPNYQPSMFMPARPFTETSGIDPADLFLPGMVKAWHGSPHKFSKFRMDKIGTGEGAQAFGYGLYFSEVKGVAKTYASINREDLLVLLNGKPFNSVYKGDNSYSVARFIEDSRGSVKNLEIELKYAKKRGARERVKAVEDAIDVVKNNKIDISDPDTLYRVKLHPGRTDEVWLDWDKPVPKDIADKLVKDFESGKLKLNESAGTRGFVEGLRGLDVNKKLEGIGYKVKGGKVYKKDGTLLPQKIIDAQKQLWESSVIYRDAGHFYRDLSHMLGSDRIASMVLKDAGIDGIRYPAGSLSGMKDKGAKNYVVFDENAIEMIKEK